MPVHRESTNPFPTLAESTNPIVATLIRQKYIHEIPNETEDHRPQGTFVEESYDIVYIPIRRIDYEL